MELLWIEKAGSTNNYLKENSDTVMPMTMVMAKEQTAGRGQRGNSWESEPGKNLTFSFYFRPEGVHPAEQFVISEAVALAMVSVLDHYGIEAKVKWPNDIYVGNRKITGILIENSILGPEISRCIVGIGLNVNQKEFRSDAPNPVSLTMLTGEDYSLEQIAAKTGEAMERLLALIPEKDELHGLYMKKLWRGKGEHPFRDVESGTEFMGEIEDVESSGHLILRKKDTGERKRYAFKEVAFVLP